MKNNYHCRVCGIMYQNIDSDQICGNCLLDEIRRAKDALNKAEQLKCICSSFTLQYDGGCECNRGEKIVEAEKRLQCLINKI